MLNNRFGGVFSADETVEKVPLGQVFLVEAFVAASMPPFGFDFATSMSPPKHPHRPRHSRARARLVQLCG